MWLGSEYRSMVSHAHLAPGAALRDSGAGALLRLSSRPEDRRLGREIGLDPRLFRRAPDDDDPADLLPEIDWEL